MSIDLVAATLWLDMEPNRKLVLIALCDRADLRTGKCYPSLKEIEARASVSVRRVWPHLDALQELGYILRKEKGSARRRETTVRWLNVTRILAEGAARRQVLLGGEGLKVETSIDPEQPALSLDGAPVLVDENAGLVDDAAVLLDAASHPTVKHHGQAPRSDPTVNGGDVGNDLVLRIREALNAQRRGLLPLTWRRAYDTGEAFVIEPSNEWAEREFRLPKVATVIERHLPAGYRLEVVGL